jgi:hypothetical protein
MFNEIFIGHSKRDVLLLTDSLIHIKYIEICSLMFFLNFSATYYFVTGKESSIKLQIIPNDGRYIFFSVSADNIA